MSFSPNLFLSHLNAKGGPAKPCRFEVILPIPTYINSFIENSILEKILNLPNSVFSDVTDAVNNALPDALKGGGSAYSASSNPSMSRYLALQCDSASLPGKTLQTADVKIYGPSFKVPYRAQYDAATFSFICTNEFEERKLFDRWLEAIIPNDTNNVRYPKGSNSRYMTNIKIIQYDDFIKQIYAVELIDAFPIGIGPQDLNWGDSGFHKLNVQFAYQKFKTIYQGSYNIDSALTALAGSAVTRVLPIR